MRPLLYEYVVTFPGEIESFETCPELLYDNVFMP